MLKIIPHRYDVISLYRQLLVQEGALLDAVAEPLPGTLHCVSRNVYAIYVPPCIRSDVQKEPMSTAYVQYPRLARTQGLQDFYPAFERAVDLGTIPLIVTVSLFVGVGVAIIILVVYPLHLLGQRPRIDKVKAT